LKARMPGLAGASNRDRTGTPPHGKAADFKSAVSTNFTIEAHEYCGSLRCLSCDQGINANAPHGAGHRRCGGAIRSRTGLDGFAIRCITALLSRRKKWQQCPSTNYRQKREAMLPFFQTGAGNETRTRDLNLGKVALYQLSYSRISSTTHCARRSH
jgi:hypothetical protein